MSKALRALVLGAVCAAGVAGWSLVALASSPSGVNVNGDFHVKEVAIAESNIVGLPLGTAYYYVWAIAPHCSVGSCAARVAGPNQLALTITPSAAGYRGSGIFSGDCYESTSPYSLIARHAYEVHYSTQLATRNVIDGAAHSLAGTLSEDWVPNATGEAHDCAPASETWRFTGTAIAGTVHNALPPPKKKQPRPAATTGRSSIASALVTASDAFPANSTLLLDTILAVIAMLVVTFPAQIFNRTLDEHYGELKELADKRLPVLGKAVRATRRVVRTSPTRAFVAVLVLGSIVGCFNDPTFGFNATSARTLVAVILAFCVAVATSAAVGAAYRRARGMELKPVLHALPAGLLVAVGCVVVSRLTNFEPGYLYGVIAGVAFSTAAMGHKERGHEVALVSVATLAIAVAAWLLWSGYHTTFELPGQPFGVRVADTLLASLFVSGVVSTLINLLPVESLAGATLFRWHRGVWALLFGASVFVCFAVLLNPAARSGHGPQAPLVTTWVLFGVFGALSIGFNRYFALRARREAVPATTAPDGAEEVSPSAAAIAAAMHDEEPVDEEGRVPTGVDRGAPPHVGR